MWKGGTRGSNFFVSEVCYITIIVDNAAVKISDVWKLGIYKVFGYLIIFGARSYVFEITGNYNNENPLKDSE